MKWQLLELLIGLRRAGKEVVGYGAPGKGNTLLNYCGIRADLLDYTVDRNPHKHGRFLPGTHIPIHPPERIAETRPTRPDPALEPAAGDRGAARLRPGLGRRARRPDSAPGGRGVSPRRSPRLKVVLFCGGLGLRMGESTTRVPKPMITIGDRPILWHIMKYYANFGFRRLHPLPRLQGRRHQAVLPQLQRGALERLRAFGRRPADRAGLERHPRLVDHVRRHGSAVERSVSGCGASSPTSAATRSSSPTTATGSPTPRSRTWSSGCAQATRPPLFLSSRPTYNFHVASLDGLEPRRSGSRT